MVRYAVADGPDVVCLQEVPVWALRKLEEWSGMQAVGEVARAPRLGSEELGRRLTKLHHGILRSAFTGEGDAILVAPRFAVSHERTLIVSASGLRRIVHGLRLDGRIFVANFHTAGDEQFRRVADLVESQADSEAIVAGDANVRPGEGTTYELLRQRGFSEPLPGSIDQILVRGLKLVSGPREGEHTLDGVVLSDHAPIEAVVE
jgi:endonuclease/exonuclease/phosphatase family metal-dependent hydrolase